MKRWYEISKNPNLPEVKLARQNTLVAARSKLLIDDRISYLSELVKGKDLLDIGVVAHDAGFVSDSKWLHKYLAESAKSCLGVDILQEEVDKLRSQGFNIICTDVIKDPLKDQFDVVICGEVLEHVDAPGHLLASCAKMVRQNGRLVITVPNPWYIGYMMKNIFNGPPLEDNVDHVSWFDPCTICELAERQGFVMANFKGIRHSEHNRRFTVFKKIVFGMIPIFLALGMRPELFAKTMIYEFVFP